MKVLTKTALAALFAVSVGLVGCDRASETHSTTTTDREGNVVKHAETKKSVDDAGNVRVEEKRSDTR